VAAPFRGRRDYSTTVRDYCDFPRAVIGQITSTLSLRMP
jgi:hypothetical protein